MRRSLIVPFVFGMALAGAYACDGNNAKPAQTTKKATKRVARPTPAPANPKVEHSPGSSPVDDHALVAEGRTLYMTACANCHGRDGTGNVMRRMMPKIGDHTSAALHARFTDEQMADYVAKGRGKMPPFGTIYKRDQIQAIVAYVRTLKKGG